MAIGPFLLAAIGGQGGAVIPGAPGTLSLSNGSNSGAEINLSWSAPSDDGGAAVSGYKIQISTNGSSWSDSVANTGSTATTATVSSLTVVTQYWFRVAAINAVGTGAFGNEPNHTTTYHVVSYSTTGSTDIAPTYTEGGNTYQAVRFLNTGSFTVSSNPGGVTCDILMVGGGGGASGSAQNAGGGGGAGGYRVFTGQTLTVGTSNITIGSGGSGYKGNVHPTGNGTNGADTATYAGVFPNYYAAGGGGGGYSSQHGRAGGSGGGAGSAFSGSFNGGAGNSPSTSPAQGENGGTSPNSGGYYCYNQGGGGIGGRTGSWGQSGTPAGGAGNWDPSHQVGISYYDGTTSYVDDTSGNHNPYVGKRYFAGGGGGCSRDAWGTRTSGAGATWKRGGTGFSYASPSGWNNFAGGMGRFGAANGRGASSNVSAASGTANSGSGGGGGGGGSVGYGGGNGGSGCVIIRWRVG